MVNYGLNSAIFLAQLNLGTNAASLLGIFLALAGAGLYFLRSFRPELSRDQDIFFAAVGLLCGGILLTQGWRLDPILQFSQFLLTGSVVFFAFEAIRMRGVTTEVAKRNTPIVDDDRPVSRAYRYDDQEAELYDQIEPDEERYANRRLRGTVDSRSSSRDRYEGANRRPKSRGSSASDDWGSSGERTPKRRPRPSNNRPPERSVDTWDAQLDRDNTDWEEKPSRSSRPRPSTNPENSYSESERKPRKRRPPQDETSSPRSRDLESTPTDVDYQPIDSSQEDKDQPGRFDY
jgi:hypothetical protein